MWCRLPVHHWVVSLLAGIANSYMVGVKDAGGKHIIKQKAWRQGGKGRDTEGRNNTGGGGIPFSSLADILDDVASRFRRACPCIQGVSPSLVLGRLFTCFAVGRKRRRGGSKYRVVGRRVMGNDTVCVRIANPSILHHLPHTPATHLGVLLLCVSRGLVSLVADSITGSLWWVGGLASSGYPDVSSCGYTTLIRGTPFTHPSPHTHRETGAYALVGVLRGALGLFLLSLGGAVEGFKRV